MSLVACSCNRGGGNDAVLSSCDCDLSHSASDVGEMQQSISGV